MADVNLESDKKILPLRESEFDKNDNYDMISKNVNRSRSMLNKFNQNNNTTDSRISSK